MKQTFYVVFEDKEGTGTVMNSFDTLAAAKGFVSRELASKQISEAVILKPYLHYKSDVKIEETPLG